ncbi:VTT domain-containing protein [Pseudarthrobacter sp. RMG13]|uniref:VTT domain-containing protein n=1 Tax=Pseudarthrobacter humi TaxID=2952523 RepID=A0ABT1LQY0_9MICC|nr:VTT domain-containing protein [Pseudarthrobacter humi]MCP9000858.1 VTT domain-containing protein [Pseudarthrobacter humi]
MDQFLDLPFGVAAASLFAIVMLRVNVTYWIGRGAAAGVEHTRFASSWNGQRAGQAKALVRRWGPFAVTLSFLTIGLQTAVNLAAGAAKMPLRRYLPAAVAGSILWALVYATVGLAAVEAWLALAAASPWGFAVLAAAAAGLIAWLLVRRRRRPGGSAAEQAEAGNADRVG